MSCGANPRFSALERPDKASLPNGNLRYYLVIVPLLKIHICGVRRPARVVGIHEPIMLLEEGDEWVPSREEKPNTRPASKGRSGLSHRDPGG
jgi:hypothetical protein